MRADDFNNLRPEDHWPEAEKMLDGHFKQKKARRKFAWIFAGALLLSAAGGYYFLSNNNEAAIVNNAETNSLSTTPVEKPINTPQQKVNQEGVGASQNEINTEVQNNSPQVNLAPDKSLQANKPNASVNRVIANQSNVNVVAPSQQQTNKVVAASNVQSNDKNFDKNAVNATKSSDAALAINSKEREIQNASSELAKKDVPATQNLELTQIAASTSSQESTKEEVSPMLMSQFVLPEQTRQNSLQERMTEKGVAPKTKFGTEWRLDLLAGASYVSKDLTASKEVASKSRRQNEEANIVTPDFHVAISKVTKNFALSAGLGVKINGEKLNYNPYSMKNVLVDDSHWDSYMNNITLTDTNYLYGYVYYTERNLQQIDSTYVIQLHEESKSVYDANSAAHNQVNQLYYVEMPISATWYFAGNKFRSGISAGISPAMLAGKSGYYLKDDLSGLESFNDVKSFSKFTVSAQIGLDFRYLMSAKCHLLLRPTYSKMLTSATSSERALQQKYNGVGVQAGVSVLIH
jgi:hypothetical protein